MVAALALTHDGAGVEAASVWVHEALLELDAQLRPFPIVAAGELVDAGTAEELEGNHAAYRVAGQADVRHAATVRAAEAAEGQGLAGAHAHGPEADIAFLEQHVLDDVVVA